MILIFNISHYDLNNDTGLNESPTKRKFQKKWYILLGNVQYMGNNNHS